VPAGLQENIPLAPRTTFGIGGPARYFIEAATESDAVDALDFAARRSVPVFILGGGSNLLVADRGFPGLVLRIAVPGVAVEPDGRRVLLRAGAGEDWDGVVARAVDRNLQGIACLSGIPGSVGGTPVQNVGAYGQEISDVLAAVRVLDRQEQQLRDLPLEACGLAYRTSVFNTVAAGRYIVLGVTYALHPAGDAAVRYPELRKRLEGLNRPPTLGETRAAVREIRASKGMLLQAGDPDCRSAGSFFKNPILGVDAFGALAAMAPDAPRYPAPEGRVKTSAAWLIERAGFSKGYARRAAALSAKHALAIVNRGGATADDVLALAREVRLRVEERFGIRLQPEPVFVGFDEPF
jgi:UDP-N-acetylmuramate dehydrogenase